MENQKSYTIATIKDIAVKIPADKLDAFFFDLRAAVGQQKAILDNAAELLGEEGHKMMVDALQEKMVWTDDGKAEVTSTIRVNKEHIANVTVDYSSQKR
ncbi:hypothetical protein LZ626_09760 [Aeromonas allosaccharophila]|uniref:hypothetical protein n=1 Tax=Aeromonas allosaccharophila TaxID=656 RepID=UPI001F30B9F2|nr:hypothetical protein [Aeromonas allosaccharophila]MCE9848373.1 hypothetical protein [Aeromonas allosaccharophila]